MPEHPAIKRDYATMPEVIELRRGPPPTCPECGGRRIWIISLITSRRNPDGTYSTTGGNEVAYCYLCHKEEIPERNK